MVSKDQAIGGVICLVCVAVGVLYTVGLFWFGAPFDAKQPWAIQFWLIAIPVFIAFVAIMGIGAWIGWTMATTPPPKPIEEITSEIETEEKKTTEEKPAEEAEPIKEEAEKKEEEKKPERKRKGE
jgi:predicted DNA-binding transcriptional regulator